MLPQSPERSGKFGSLEMRFELRSKKRWMILPLDYFNGMGLQRFFSESATLPQLKQICLGFFVIVLISSNFSLLARTQICPV
jgi:hypothetical protein